MIEKGICDKGLIWNPSNCDCECDTSCDAREYLDYESCKCRKRLIDKLVEECIGDIDEKKLHSNKMVYNSTLNDHQKVCNSCKIYIILFAIAFLIIMGLSSLFIYFHWYLKRRYIQTTSY